MDDSSVPSDRPAEPGALLGTPMMAGAGEDTMSLTVERAAGVSVVGVAGEVDLLTASRLGDTLGTEISAGPAVLVVDLGLVRFFTSMGLTALALAQRAARENGVDMRVVAAGRATLRPLQITGMVDELDVYASRGDALADRTTGSSGAFPTPRIG